MTPEPVSVSYAVILGLDVLVWAGQGQPMKAPIIYYRDKEEKPLSLYLYNGKRLGNSLT